MKKLILLGTFVILPLCVSAEINVDSLAVKVDSLYTHSRELSKELGQTIDTADSILNVVGKDIADIREKYGRLREDYVKLKTILKK